MRLRIGALIFVLAFAPPAAGVAQTPTAGQAGIDNSHRPRSVVQCTEAAPCATPHTRARPAKAAPSASVVRQFRENHPCPTTAHTWGACPGYVVTHITPACKGGLDEQSNLQWQTHASADRQDRTACR